jgi:hypothetical protein
MVHARTHRRRHIRMVQFRSNSCLTSQQNATPTGNPTGRGRGESWATRRLCHHDHHGRSTSRRRRRRSAGVHARTHAPTPPQGGVHLGGVLLRRCVHCPGTRSCLRTRRQDAEAWRAAVRASRAGGSGGAGAAGNDAAAHRPADRDHGAGAVRASTTTLLLQAHLPCLLNLLVRTTLSDPPDALPPLAARSHRCQPQLLTRLAGFAPVRAATKARRITVWQRSCLRGSDTSQAWCLRCAVGIQRQSSSAEWREWNAERSRTDRDKQ